MDSKYKLTTKQLLTKETEMAIVEVEGPGIWMQKCIYAPKPEWRTPPNVWEKMIVVESGRPGTSDLFWELMWFPLAEGMTLEELEIVVRASYPQFPEGVYEIHRLGLPS